MHLPVRKDVISAIKRKNRPNGSSCARSQEGDAENAGVENAGVENAGVDSRGGKCRSGKCRSR